MAATYDAIVIGAGQAAPYLAGRFAAAGMTVAMVERALFGGTCVNTGCVPTKTMVASAHAAHAVRRAAEFGVHVSGGPTVDMRQVKARKDAVSGHVRTGLEEWLKGLRGCTVYEGHARFVSPYEVVVGAETLTADRIFLNVGGRAVVPAMPGLDQVPYLTNSSMMEVDFLPRHLLVVGGSYVGLEFAQMFRRFGSEVTIVEMGPRLIGREDEDVSAVVQAVLEREGVMLRLNATCLGFARRGDAIVGRVDCSEGAPEITASHVLLAVGRRPNTDDLGLAQAGVAVDRRGYLVVDDELRTSVRGIWAVGDCNGKGAFTHTSFNDAEIVAANLLDGETRRVSDRIPAYALYVDPPLGRAGLTDAQVRASGRRALVATRAMRDVKRAVIKGETDGFMKIVVDADTREILGAAVLGPGGDEIIHSILDVMYAKAPWPVLRRAMHIHPTVSELIPTMLGDLRPLEAPAAAPPR
jgi:pyruvate/2-oxoglutarate dehydrogenase complex dihydrolipoamide dehydrogenase (E3) component